MQVLVREVHQLFPGHCFKDHGVLVQTEGLQPGGNIFIEKTPDKKKRKRMEYNEPTIKMKREGGFKLPISWPEASP